MLYERDAHLPKLEAFFYSLFTVSNRYPVYVDTQNTPELYFVHADCTEHTVAADLAIQIIISL
jgi:hypothetical protein